MPHKIIVAHRAKPTLAKPKARAALMQAQSGQLFGPGSTLQDSRRIKP